MQSRFITIYFWNRRKDPEIAEIFVIQEVNDGKQRTYKLYREAIEMETVQKQQSQEKHNHNHGHDHDHGKMPVVLYFVGLALAVIALFLNEDYQLLQNVLFSIATISAGYHVIVLEGLGETIENSKNQKKFMPNSHILMGLAAIGASLMGNFWEGTLLILIFSGAHFLEDYAEGRSKREITKLLEMNPTTARLILPDGSTKNVDVSELKVGDQLQVLNGDQVPIDGVWIYIH